MNKEKIKKFVKERYSKIAKESAGCCPTCSSCGSDAIEQAKKIGYSKEELKNIPESAIMGLGCGNPVSLANVKEGETVLDLGAGAGIDVFLAANKVGPRGFVIGVDMTEEMVKKANKIAKKADYKNVEFRVGEIENLPIKDNSVDLIISNCVINLSSDKLKTYQEAYRVLKSGGRVLISDLVTEEELPEEIRKNLNAWAECIAGALEKKEYLSVIKKAGFKDINIVSQETFYELGLNNKLAGKIISAKIKAYK